MSNNKSIVTLINSDQMKQQFVKAMNSPKMIDRFLRLATSAINQTPNLAECSASSIVGALLKSAQLNLEPNTILGECYLIPRRIKGKWEANFEMGYKGLIKLAYRSGDVKLVQAYEVYESDNFDADYGENKVIHKPVLSGNRGGVIAYWARYILKDGTSDFKVWTREDIESHRDQYSKGASSDYSPWSTAFDQMAKKTVIKDALRYAPLSVEDYAHMMASDATVINAELPAGYKPQSTADMLTMPESSDQTEGSEPVQAYAAVHVIAPKAAEPASGFEVVGREPDPMPATEQAQTEEQHRLDMLKKVEDRITELGWGSDKVLEKTGKPLSMIKRSSTDDLVKIYGDLK